MSDGKKKRIVFYALSSAVVVFLVSVLYFFPVSAINRSAAYRIKSYLESQLKTQVNLSGVEVNWNYAVLRGIAFDIDKNGSRVEIDKITLSYSPANLVEELGHLEKLLTSVSVENLRVNFTSGKTAAQEDSKLIPELRITDNFYDIAKKFDRLEYLSINNTVLSLDDQETSSAIVSNGVIQIFQKEGIFTLAGSADLATDSIQKVTLDGNLDPKSKQLYLTGTGNLGSIALLKLIGVDELKSLGGSFHLILESKNSLTSFSATSRVDSATVVVSTDTLLAENLLMSLSNDTLRIDSGQVFFSSGSGTLGGHIDLSSKTPALGLTADLDLSQSEKLQRYFKYPDIKSERVLVKTSLSGDFNKPRIEADLSCADAVIGGIPISNIQGQVVFFGRQLEARELSFDTRLGRIVTDGVVQFDKVPTLTAKATLELYKAPDLLGLQSSLKKIALTASGEIDKPDISAEYFSDSLQTLCVSRIINTDGVWNLYFENGKGVKQSTASLGVADEKLNLSLQNAQNIFHYFFVDPKQINLSPLSDFDLKFSGNAESGDFNLRLKVKQDSTQFWTEVAKEFYFSGQYAANEDSSYHAKGFWSGINGYSTNFSGRASLYLNKNLVEVSELFIDEAGSLSGQIDFVNKSINLSGRLEQLSFDRFPLRPKFVEKSNLKGMLSGNLSVTGNLSEPNWNANFSMVDGSVFDVPNYWLNSSLSGHGLKTEINLFELGRNTLKIIEASGQIDLKNNLIDVSAKAGSARAEDFITALTGLHGLVSGELNGQAYVSGQLSAPDIVSEINISEGKLFQDIVVDEFHAKFESHQDSAGRQTVALPLLSFYRRDKYYFDGNLFAIPVKGGEFQAHFAGTGNFLDIVDQFDRTFTASQGNGKLSVEFGGTFDKPELREGILTLNDGEFSFSDATPVVVKTDINIQVSAPGNVDYGNIHFSNGDQVLDINMLPVAESSNTALNPLIIPIPRINLGIIEITTTSDGFPIHLPGFMKEDWIGTLSFGKSDEKPLTISGYDDYRLLIQGQMGIKNARVTFPFISTGSAPKAVAKWLLQRVIEAKFDLDVAVGQGNHYDVEITGLKDSDAFAPLRDSYIFSTLADYFDHLSIDALISPTESPLEIRESISDSSFHILGRMNSYRGKVEYLDQTFEVDYMTADFDGTNPFPILEGRAITYGVDSLSRRVPVYLTMYQVDRETKIKYKRGRFDNITFLLETDNSTSPEEALSYLGYGAGNATNKAGEVVTATVARLIRRQWLEPIERRIEQLTPLDEVTFVPGGGRTTNLARLQREQASNDTLETTTLERLYSGSQITLGKYLGNDLYLSYTGELLGRENTLQGTRLGFLHFWNLEYRVQPLSPDLVLDFAVEYDEIERKRDESVSLKYSFILEP